MRGYLSSSNKIQPDAASALQTDYQKDAGLRLEPSYDVVRVFLWNESCWIIRTPNQYIMAADKDLDQTRRNDISRRMAELKKEDREKQVKEMRERLAQHVNKAARKVSNIHEKTQDLLRIQAEQLKQKEPIRDKEAPAR